MNNDHQKATQALDALLADDGHMSVDELRSELESLGVDVDAFLSDFTKAVRKSYQQRVRSAAEKANVNAESAKETLFGDLHQKTKEELLAIREQVMNGVFGALLQTTSTARCRNLQGAEVSESELRSWLEDISAAGSKQ